jgi:hypothetical protein
MAHLLSDLETRLLLELRWAPEFSDIREQVPLDLDVTLAIAQEIGIEHPLVPGDGAPVVMTTDIVCLYSDPVGSVICARSVKPSREIDIHVNDRPRRAAELFRTLEKLEIEKRYWQRQGADWRFVCEQDLDRVRAANIQLLLSWGGLDPAPGPVFWQDALDLSARTLAQGQDRTLGELGQSLERQGKLSQAHFMDCVRQMSANRILRFDMRQHFGPDLRACDFAMASA